MINTSKGIYHFNDEEQAAELSLQKNRLIISLKDGRQIFWYYEQIKRDKLYHFKYTGYPPQSLQVSSGSFGDELESRILKGSGRPNLGKLTPLAKVLIGLLFFLVLLYFLVVPWVASLLANRFPVSYEKSIGDQAFNSMKADFKIDETRSRYINEFFKQLAIPSKYPVQVTVVKGDVLNAFALPGGHVVVYDKIINGIGSYEELAALLSHEFTHIENRHTVRTLFRQLGSKVFLSLVLGDASAVGGVIIDNADQLKSLSYSRSLEKEADENGVRLLSERKIDCAGFVRLFQMLKKETTGIAVSEWMSSHPDLDKRIRNIQDNVYCKKATPQKDSALHHFFLMLRTAD